MNLKDSSVIFKQLHLPMDINRAFEHLFKKLDLWLTVLIGMLPNLLLA